MHLIIMRVKFITLLVLFFSEIHVQAQKPMLRSGSWLAAVVRQDGRQIAFNMEWLSSGSWVIINGTERINIDDIITIGDSLEWHMPVFESFFRAKIQADGSLMGYWYKGSSTATQVWPFYARPGVEQRFEALKGPAKYRLNGRWAVSFTRKDGTKRAAIAELHQEADRLSGSILTPSGGYRYLDGIVTGDSMILSVFDGSNAYLLTGKIRDDRHIALGTFYSGPAGIEPWQAVYQPDAALPQDAAGMTMKEGYQRLSFRFPALDGRLVSINDDAYKNKVVVIQIMGSWCSNCMDETRFLSQYYKANRHRGVEVIALAYEYSSDPVRSGTSLRKFKERFNVEYPMLLTGVAVNDPERTQKTLPEITDIKVFPSTLFIGRDGKVKAFHAGFYGPGSGGHYEESKQFFESTVDRLLKEPG